MLFVRDYLGDRTIHREIDAPRDPLVSVILPTYSRLKDGLLKRSIDSILAQSFTNFELIVMDDGSRDGSSEFIRDCCTRDPRVVHVRHDRNSGLPGLRVNEGITLSRGRFIAFQFDDDAWRPDALKRLTESGLENGDEAVVVGTATLHYPHALHFPRAKWDLPDVELKSTNFSSNNHIANNSVLIPRVLFDRLGMYDCHLAMRRMCDYDLWMRFMRHVPFVDIGWAVSDCFCLQEGSLELTVSNDLSLFRYIHEIPRNHLLTPDCWQDYEIDSARIGEITLPGSLRRRLYEDQVLPYYLKMRHRFPALDRFPAAYTQDLSNCVVLSEDDDLLNQVYLKNYDDLSSRRGAFKVHHQPPRQVTANALPASAEAVMIFQLRDSRDLDLTRSALDAGLPVASLPDDDLLQSPRPVVQDADRDPESRADDPRAAIIAAADAVWVPDTFHAQAIHTYNRRTVPHTGCMPPEWLPDHLPRRDPGRPLRIGLVGIDDQTDELGFFWDALARASDQYGTAVELEFWGVEIGELPQFNANVRTLPSPSSYFEQLNRLHKSCFDILLVPVIDRPRLRSRPAPTLYQEAAVAAALGIFSDIPPHSTLPGGETCLKAENTAAGWLKALRQAISMPAEDLDRIRSSCLTHVRETATSTALIDRYEAAWRATQFHQLTRDRRLHDGRPRITYFLPSPSLSGTEIELWRHLRLVLSYGMEPFVILPESMQHSEALESVREKLEGWGVRWTFAEYTSFNEPITPPHSTRSPELEGLISLLRDLKPALVHSSQIIPGVGEMCRYLNIPHVTTLNAIDDQLAHGPVAKVLDRPPCDLALSASIHSARRWGDLLGVQSLCVRPSISEALFDTGRRRTASHPTPGSNTSDPPPPRPTRIVMQGSHDPHKSQLAAIEAVASLIRNGYEIIFNIYMIGFCDPVFVAECRERIVEYQAQGAINVHVSSPDVTSALQEAEILLCSSASESLPTSICEAMAAGVLVVSTPAGGVAELIVDEVSGVLCRGSRDLDILEGLRRAWRLPAEERARIVAQARRVALAEFHPDRAANDLFAAYAQAIRTRRASSATAAGPIAVVEEATPLTEVSQCQPSCSRLRQTARRVDTALLKLLDVHPTGHSRTGRGFRPHSSSPPRGPHLLKQAYCRLRRSVRRVDNALARIL